MKRLLAFVAMALLMSAISVDALAQGTLSGVVSDQTGAVIPSAEVTVTNTATGVATTVVTNSAGSYSVPNLLTPGVYELETTFPGFQNWRAENIDLGTNQTLRFDPVLEVQAAGTEIEVVVDASRVLAETSPTVGDVLTEAQVSDLPLVGSDVLDLIGVMAGIRGGTGSANTTFAGIGADSVNTVRDGLSVSSGRFANGVFGTTNINPDMVAEVRLILTPVDAEYGRGNGQVQVTTRSGTNRFQGSAVWNIRNSALDANTWDNNNDLDSATGLWSPTEPDWLNQNEYTLTFGGPIVRNRTFFFALWDHQMNRTRELVESRVLTPLARQGIYRYFEGWSNGSADAATTTTGGNPTRAVVDFSGNPLTPTSFPNGSPYTGGLRCFSVFGSVKADGSPFTGADCPGGTIVGPDGGGAWDDLRPQMDSTGFIANFMTFMPAANDYTGGDGLNTAVHRWVRGNNSTGSTFGAAVGTNNSVNRKQMNIKVDHNFTDNHKANVGLTVERSLGGVNLSNWPTGFNGETTRRPWVLTSNLTSALSPTLVNEVRFGIRKDVLEQNPTWESLDSSTREGAREFWLRNSAGQAAVFNPGAGGGGPTGVSFPATGFGASSPYSGGSANGSYSPLYSFGDTLSWVRGVHAFKFGGEARLTRSNGYSNIPALALPVVAGGAGGNTASGISTTAIDGLNTNDQTRARNLLYMLAGSVNSATQGYWVDEPGDVETGTWESYFTEGSDGYTEELGGRNYREQVQNEISFFVKDDWKITQRLTLNLGLRWDYYGSPYLNQGLTTTLIGQGDALFGTGRTGQTGNVFDPWLQPGNVFLAGYGPDGGLECAMGVSNGPNLPASNCDPSLLSSPEFVGPNSPQTDKAVYRNDLNNWGPAIGFAWDLPWGGTDQTILRGGYQITYGGSGRNVFGDGGRIGGALGISLGQNTNDILSDLLAAQPDGYLDLTDLDAIYPIAPQIVPGGTLPVYARSNGFDAFDPNLVTPYVQNFNLSLTRQLGQNMTVQLSYVGTQARKQVGAFDVNLYNVFHNDELMDALEITRAGGNAPLFDQMFAGVNLAANLNPAPGSADYTPVGTVNDDGVLQTGSLHLRRAQATNLASGDFFEVAEYINETNPSGSVQGLLSAPFSGVGGQLLRNGCNQMADGASTIGDITGDANGLSGTALRCFAENYIGINPQFDEGADYVTNTGSSGYHSLQTQFTLRPTFGTNLRATYTWSKSMALSADSWTDPLNRNADWTLAGNHRTHDFRVNGTFQLPIGPGQLLLGNSSGFLARAVEGWRMSWIYSAVSGAPLSVSTFTAGGGGTGVNMFYANGTPDVVGDFDLRSGNVEWGADIGAADLGGGYLDGFTVVEDPQCVGITDFTDAMGWNFRSQGDCELTAVADGSGQVVLQNPMPGTRGNLGQRTVEGPGDWSLDASLSKDFQVSERMMFQLRVDAENVLNHPSPDDPLLNINDTDIPWGFIEEKSNDSRTFEIQMRLNF